jgi:hypothetical protein
VGGTTPEETENDGWKLVHVFQGQDDKHLEILTPFSQGTYALTHYGSIVVVV